MNEDEETAAPPSILVQLAAAYTRAEAEVDNIKQTLKNAEVRRDIAEKKLTEEMITQQVKSFKANGLGGFRTQAVVYPNVKDREAFNAYIKKKKLTWLYTMSVNGQKLRAFTKELLEQGKPIPPGIEPYTTTEIRRYK